MDGTSITVLVADTTSVVREGFRVLLESFGMRVVGRASSLEQSVAELAHLRPDAIVLNVTIEDVEATIGALRQASPGSALITYAGFGGDQPPDETLWSRADAHVSMTHTRTEMVETIRRAVALRQA